MKKLLIGILVVLLLAIIGAFLLVDNINSIVKQGIEETVPQMLKAPVSVAAVDISVFSGRGEITGLKIGNPEGYKGDYAFALGKILLEVEPISFTTDTIHVKSLVIESPSIAYEGNLNDSNIQQLQRNVESLLSTSENSKPQQPEIAGESATSLQIDYFAITNTNATVELPFLSGDPLVVEIPDLELRDIGKDEDRSAADVLELILVKLNQALIPAIERNAGGLSDQLQGKGKDVESKVKKGLNKLKSIFGN